MFELSVWDFVIRKKQRNGFEGLLEEQLIEYRRRQPKRFRMKSLPQKQRIKLKLMRKRLGHFHSYSNYCSLCAWLYKMVDGKI